MSVFPEIKRAKPSMSIFPPMGLFKEDDIEREHLSRAEWGKSILRKLKKHYPISGEIEAEFKKQIKLDGR